MTILLQGVLEPVLVSALLTQRCLDMRGLFCNLGFNRCGFYVAVSSAFSCCCPHRWGREADHKTCLWNFGQTNADMTATEQRMAFWTHPPAHYSESPPDESCKSRPAKFSILSDEQKWKVLLICSWMVWITVAHAGIVKCALKWNVSIGRWRQR